MLKHVIYGGHEKAKENRLFAQLPQLPDNRESLLLWSSRFDDYLADSFGFRRVLIRSANKLRFYLFNQLPMKNITKGQNDFIYLNSHSKKRPDVLMKFICAVNEPSEKVQSKTIQSLQNFVNKYQQSTFKFNMLIVPLKAQIYPENLPAREKEWCVNEQPNWFDKILNPSLTNGKEDIVYPLALFKSWKMEFPVYLSNHFHWHGELPYRMADHLMTSLWEITPDLFPEAKKTEVKSDLSHFLDGLEFMAQSSSYDYSPFKIEVCKGRSCNKNLKKIYQRIYQFNYKRKTVESNKRLVILSDSFGPLIGKHFIRGFDEVNVINLNNLAEGEKLQFFQQVFAITKPTHVLFLVNAGGLYSKSNLFKKLLDTQSS